MPELRQVGRFGKPPSRRAFQSCNCIIPNPNNKVHVKVLTTDVDGKELVSQQAKLWETLSLSDGSQRALRQDEHPLSAERERDPSLPVRPRAVDGDDPADSILGMDDRYAGLEGV